MAGVPYKSFTGAPPRTAVESEPPLWDVFLEDLKGAPGKLLQMFVGEPLQALNDVGVALQGTPGIPVTEQDFDQARWTQEGLMDAAGVLSGLANPGAHLAAAAVSPEENLLSVFAGVRAKTANKEALQEASDKAIEATSRNTINAGERRGLTPDDIDEIFQATGWFPGADKRWRFEIPDVVEARAGLPNPDQMFMDYVTEQKKMWGERATPQALWNNARVDLPGLTRRADLDMFIKHPELFKAYPELAELKTTVTGAPGNAPSGVNNLDKTIEAKAGTQEDLISVLLHEVQHEIQTKEGFANGGNPEAMGQYLAQLVPNAADQLNYPKPYDLYQSLMGEVEARTVQERYELGTAMGTPRFGDIFAPSNYMEGSAGTASIPHNLQLDPLWFHNPMNVPGAPPIMPVASGRQGEARAGGEELLRQRMLQLVQFFRDQEAKKFMKAASQ